MQKIGNKKLKIQQNYLTVMDTLTLAFLLSTVS